MKFPTIPGALALLVAASAALAHQGVQNPAVLARMEAMSAIGDATKVLGEMAKGARAFDAAAAREAAARIADESARTPALFEAEETDPKSEALPAIWQDFADFAAKSDALDAAAREAAAGIRTQADLPAALARIGEACKACHERYRQP